MKVRIKKMMNQVNNMRNQMDLTDDKYPEVYKVLYPISTQMIVDMEAHYESIILTDDVLNSMAEEVIQRSGLLTQTAPSGALIDDAVPTMASPPRWGRGGDSSRRWGHHSRSTLHDIASILLLQQIFGRRRPRWRW